MLLDRNGVLLSAHVASDGQWRFAEADSVPEKFATALIAFEDKHFHDHLGVYLPSLFRAAKQNMQAGKVKSGGSTITMQTIRLSRNNPKRTYFEKATEILRALRLELSYSKEEILLMYATHAPMGGNVVGLETASWRYFGRSPHDLSWAESATLAVLPNAPALIFPGKNRVLLKEKRDRLLRTLMQDGAIDSMTYELSIAEPIPGKPYDLPQDALHLLHHLENNSISDTKRFQSTIDHRLQEKSQSSINQRINNLQRNLVFNAAALVCDTRTGEVLAYVGNASNSKKERHVDIIQAPRSPGSTLKPFLYMAMLDDGFLTPKGFVRDVPVDFGGFSPQNFDKQFHGMVPADQALARSLNVPAVLSLQQYGVAPFHEKLKRVGFSHLNKSPSHYGLSLVLGGGEVSLYQLAGAYRSIGARVLQYDEDSTIVQGNYLRLLESEEIPSDGQNLAFSVGASYACLSALEKVKRPASEAGWEVSNTSRRIAWKTGTSYGFRDAWAVGVTPEYTVAVWVGNADGTGRPEVIGTQAAAPLLFDIFDQLPTTSGFKPPHDELYEIEQCVVSGFRATSNCPETKKCLVPKGSLNAPPCKYHQRIFTASNGERVHIDCEPNASESLSLVLPPVEGYFYQKDHPTYMGLPDWRSDCTPTEDSKGLAIIHPLHNARIKLTTDLDEQQDPLVLEAIDLKQEGTLFWHLDNTFLGATQSIHQQEVFPTSGKHTLLVMNEKGESTSIRFEIIP